MGRHRRGRRLEPHHVRQGARCGQMDPRRQDLQDRPHLRAGHAAVRRARLHATHSGRPDRRRVRPEQARLSRRISLDRDRPGRHPVRRPRPHRPSVCGHSTASGLPGWTPCQPRAGGVAPGCRSRSRRGRSPAGGRGQRDGDALDTMRCRWSWSCRSTDMRPPVPSRCASRQQAPVTQHALGQLGGRRHVVALAGLGR